LEEMEARKRDPNLAKNLERGRTETLRQGGGVPETAEKERESRGRVMVRWNFPPGRIFQSPFGPDNLVFWKNSRKLEI
jgi:hypothetical protein